MNNGLKNEMIKEYLGFGHSELFGFRKRIMNNKQLLDEVDHDIMNYQNRGLCYNTDTRFDNS